MKTDRVQISAKQVDACLEVLREEMYKRLQKHGYGSFASNHEIAGVVAEEYHEMMDALKSNDDAKYRSELLDVAVGAVFGVACMDAAEEKD